MPEEVTKIRKVKKAEKAAPIKKERYIEAIGRRKTSIARVRVYEKGIKKSGAYEIQANGKLLASYFPLARHHRLVTSPLVVSGEFRQIVARVKGGGTESQAEAIRLGISRAMVLINPGLRSKFKALGYLKRDPRMVERKKFGSRKARRPQQWRKR